VSLFHVHDKFLDVGERLLRFQLLLYRQHVLGVMEGVDDVFVAAGDGEERPRVRDDDERQAVVEDVEQVLVLDLRPTHPRTPFTLGN